MMATRLLSLAGSCCLLLALWLVVWSNPPTPGITAQEQPPQTAATDKEVGQEGSTKAQDKGQGQAKGKKDTKEKKEPAESEFLRLRRSERGRAVAMETSITTYRVPTKDGQHATVDLIGAIHVGEKTYYDGLNEKFTEYDALLFELVAPEDIKIPEGTKLESRSGVGALQTTLQSFLGLEYQLECVDYSKANFVHADMSPEQFAQSMKDRGESFFQMILRMMGQGMAMQGRNGTGGASDAEILFAIIRRDRATLKRVLAEQMSGMDDALGALAGPDGSSTIIHERNKKALEVLRRELNDGKMRLGIFYGAGHLADMQERLLKDFKATKVSSEWVLAWDLTKDHSRAK